MRRWEDVKMRRCEDEKVWSWEDVKMRRCEDEKMKRCEDEKMWRCEDEKMWRWEDEKIEQTTTIRRTLRSDALGKKHSETMMRSWGQIQENAASSACRSRLEGFSVRMWWFQMSKGVMHCHDNCYRYILFACILLWLIHMHYLGCLHLIPASMLCIDLSFA